MLIAFSGIVGSGKSTAAHEAFELLRREGVDVEYLRFRSIGVVPYRRRSLSSRRQPAAPADAPGIRRKGYRQRPLSAFAACGYAARILNFRLMRRRATGHVVCDRYFYDNLVHYTARTRRERCYIRLLLALIPRPDLAVMLVASPDTIARRRPEYASEYVTSVLRGYVALSAQCPDVVTLSTDTSEPALPHILDLVRRRVLRRATDERGGTPTRRRSNSRSLSW